MLLASVASAQNTPGAVPTTELTDLRGVFGEHVRDLNGDDAGRLWDILIDNNNKPQAAVIDYGGALGVGQRKVAVAWSAVKFVQDDKTAPVHLALTKEQLGALPEFKYGTASTTVGNGN
jgi:hypothetical protein